MRGAFLVLVGLTAVFPTQSQAACNATVNGRPMSLQECQTARQIYGSVSPGHYVVDAYGNWAKLGDPYARGNLYLDAQRPGNSGSSGGIGHWSDGGMTCYAGGCIGSDDSGIYFEPSR